MTVAATTIESPQVSMPRAKSPPEFVPAMTAEDFKTALADLGMSQGQFAKHIDAGLRTVNGWANNGPPLYIQRLVLYMLRNRIERAPINPSMDDAEYAVALPISALLIEAGLMQWDQDMVLKAIGRVVATRERLTELMDEHHSDNAESA